MKKIFLIVVLVGFVGRLVFAGSNKSDFAPKNDPNLHANGARGSSMSDYVMMAAEVIAVGAGLNSSTPSEQPYQTSAVQNSNEGPSLTKDTKGEEPESTEPGVEI